MTKESGAGDTFGFYRSGSGRVSASINGTQCLEYFADRVSFVLTPVPSVNGGVFLGKSGSQWQGLGLYPLATQPATRYDGLLAMNDGTASTLGWGASGAGLYRWLTSAWVFVG